MTRADALVRMVAAVEAGSLATISAEHIYTAFGAHLQKRFWECYQSNSLDAALALHQAVLPRWHGAFSTDGVGQVWPYRKPDDFIECECEGSPARALLLAILKALHTQEQEMTE